MEIQDAKQARPHCELIAELLDSRQPKTEREHAAVREIERLRHDIERHIAIASEYATERDRLRAELADLQDGYSRLSRDFALAIESDSKHIAELAAARTLLSRLLAEAKTLQEGWDEMRKAEGWDAFGEDAIFAEVRDVLHLTRKGEGE